MGLSNSEGYYDLEYRHGPMSLVDENTLIVCLSNKACRDGDKALMEQMKSYGATVAVLGGELGDTFDQIADYVYSMDKGWNDMQYSAIIGFIGQLLGYYIAESKKSGCRFPETSDPGYCIKINYKRIPRQEFPGGDPFALLESDQRKFFVSG